MPRPLTIPPLDEATAAALRRRYDAAADPEARLRYQVVWLAPSGQRVAQIAQAVLRSPDPVARVLHRFRAGGLDVVPRRAAPGPARIGTPAWEAELPRVIELAPHAVGVPSSNRTTGLLAAYLAERTGVVVGVETVRDVFCAQARTAVARSQARGRVAIVVADNAGTHTAAGSRSVRQPLAELTGQPELVYTPAPDPDANRIEWLWRVSCRVVTHNHRHRDLAALAAAAPAHFDHLAAHPAEVLAHTGSPGCPPEVLHEPLSLAA